MTFEKDCEIRLRRAILVTLCKRRNQEKDEIAWNLNVPAYEVMPLLQKLCEEGTLVATLHNGISPGDEYYTYAVKG